MSILSGHEVLLFGILGNIVSIFVYLAPLPAFRQIYRKKSTMGYQCLPYVVALFSSMLWIYYAFINKVQMALITINSFGCLIETLYIIAYIKYATRESRRSAVKQILSLNTCLFGFILLFTLFTFHGDLRVKIVGWICVSIAVAVFAAPLSIVLQVVRTRSIEFMPLPLSGFLTLSAIMWFTYGILKHDMVVWIPNVLGFIVGMLQMVLYVVYRRKSTPKIVYEENLPEHVINMVVVGGPEVHPVDAETCEETKNENNKTEENEEKDCNDEKNMSPPLEESSQATIQLGPNPPVLVVCAA